MTHKKMFVRLSPSNVSKSNTKKSNHLSRTIINITDKICMIT